jgi:hypothetical protein
MPGDEGTRDAGPTRLFHVCQDLLLRAEDGLFHVCGRG